MNEDFSNWKELRVVLKHDLRIKKKVCSIEEWIRVQNKLVENWWIWTKVPVKEPQNIDGAGRCEVFDFPILQAMHVNCLYSAFVSPASSFTSFCVCFSGFLEMDAVYCTVWQKSDCNLWDEFFHLFLTNTLQFLPWECLKGVAAAGAICHQKIIFTCIFKQSLMDCLLDFPDSSISFKIPFSFDFIIFKKCHGFFMLQKHSEVGIAYRPHRTGLS